MCLILSVLTPADGRLASQDILAGRYLDIVDRELKAAGSSTVDVFLHLPLDPALSLTDVVSTSRRT